eukprot:5468271-Prymnesium_polylepis.1
MLRNLLGDDEIGDEDDVNKWIREQDGRFQGINTLIDGPVELVAESAPTVQLMALSLTCRRRFSSLATLRVVALPAAIHLLSLVLIRISASPSTLPRSMVSRTAWSARMRLCSRQRGCSPGYCRRSGGAPYLV